MTTYSARPTESASSASSSGSPRPGLGRIARERADAQLERLLGPYTSPAESIKADPPGHDREPAGQRRDRLGERRDDDRGAALGGVLSAWSTGAALAVAAGLQLAAVVPLLALPPAGGRAGRAGRRLRSLRADLAEGFTALRGLPLARSVIWVGIAWGFIGGAYNVLLAAHVTGDLHGGGLLLGVFYAVDGAAVIAGTVLAARLGRGAHLAAYALAYVLQGTAWGAMFIGDWPAWAAAMLALMRTASGVIIALDTTILLATVPGRLRGRITSLHMTTYGTASRVALAASAGLLAVTGVRTVGVISGAASVLVGVAWWWLNGRRARPSYMNATSAADDPPTPAQRPPKTQCPPKPQAENLDNGYAFCMRRAAFQGWWRPSSGRLPR